MGGHHVYGGVEASTTAALADGGTVVLRSLQCLQEICLELRLSRIPAESVIEERKTRKLEPFYASETEAIRNLINAVSFPSVQALLQPSLAYLLDTDASRNMMGL